MTRINGAIPVDLLTDEHLLAEHREIKRLPENYLASKRSGSINKIPSSFRLGTGHVLFFLNKPNFTYSRYIKIHKECLKRGFNVDNYSGNWFRAYYPFRHGAKEYEPSDFDYDTLVDRISTRILDSTKKCFHYYGEAITKNEAINLLKN